MKGNIIGNTILTFALLLGMFVGVSYGSDTVINLTEANILTFGRGPVKVRIYSDYFCGACSRLEPILEETLPDIIKKDCASITFVDTPVHKSSPLYARYFLYILNEKRDLRYALKAREILFEAAKMKITEKEKLEQFLANRGIKFKPFDVIPVFKILNSYFQEDQVKATPTCVILENGQKKCHEGVSEAGRVLKSLRKGKS